LFKASPVLFHDSLLLEKQDGLYQQQKGLESANYRQIFCELGQLPFYFYALSTVVGAVISAFTAGRLICCSRIVGKVCGGLLFSLWLFAQGSNASAFLYGNPLVIWGLAKKGDCEQKGQSSDTQSIHGGAEQLYAGRLSLPKHGINPKFSHFVNEHDKVMT
jgi:hypothetical protein